MNRHLEETALLDLQHPSLGELVEQRGWRELSTFDAIGAFYAEHGSNLSGFRRWLYAYAVRHRMNATVGCIARRGCQAEAGVRSERAVQTEAA